MITPAPIRLHTELPWLCKPLSLEKQAPLACSSMKKELVLGKKMASILIEAMTQISNAV